MTTVFTPVHRQVMSSKGVEVDAGICTLLEALWAQDFVTEFSCQGETRGYICFLTEAMADRFVEFTPYAGLQRQGRFVDVHSDSLRYLARIWSAT